MKKRRKRDRKETFYLTWDPFREIQTRDFWAEREGERVTGPRGQGKPLTPTPIPKEIN